MNRSVFQVTRHILTNTAIAIFGAIFTVAALAGDKILVVHDDTLTTYQATATGVQSAQPLFQQRGVHLDGTLHHTPMHPISIAGNPYGEPWNANADFSGMRLDTGTYVINYNHLSMPAIVRWNVGISYNVRQGDAADYDDEESPQGTNWFQNSQPELVFYDPAGSADDAIYLVYAAHAYIEFERYQTSATPTWSTDTFRAVNGAAGVIYQTTVTEGDDTYDIWVLNDPNGYEITFWGFGDADIPDAIEGQIWKIEDADGNIAHVGDSTGDATNPTTALSDGYHTSGRIEYALDSSDRRFAYAYSDHNGTDRLDSVTVQEWGGSSWDATGDKVDYTYYANADSFGENGDLKLITVTVPMTVTTNKAYFKTYFRYYEGTYNALSNPGNDHHIEYIYESSGLDEYDFSGDSDITDEDFLTATDAALRPYASAYFKYEDDDPGSGDHRRITEAWFNGDCGCGSSGNNGTHKFTYESNGSYSDGAGYDTEWERRTIIEAPVVYSTEERHTTQYFDEVGQPNGKVFTNDDPSGSPTDTWAWKVIREGTSGDGGWINSIHTPENIDDYDHDDSEADGEFDTLALSGLVLAYNRVTSGGTQADAFEGFVLDMSIDDGDDPDTSHGLGGKCYPSNGDIKKKTVGDSEVNMALSTCCAPYPVTHIDFDEAGITITITVWGGGDDITIKQITKTLPTVTTAKNGSNSSNTEKYYFEKDGTMSWHEAADGIITYRAYTDGQLTTLIEDADTSHSDFSGMTPPFTSSGTEFHRKTTYTYDDRGRVETVSLPDGRVMKNNYSVLKDGRMITLQYADYDSGAGKFYGPVQMTVANKSGSVEVTSTVELDDNSGEYTTDAIATHIDETDSDPLLAIAGTSGFGSASSMTLNVYNESGVQLAEARSYFTVPASGEGTSSSNYDETTFGYDDRGRRERVVSADGTINRAVYELRNKVKEQKIGTNDEDVAGADDMVITVKYQYDGDSDGGNGLRTKQTLDEDGNWGTTTDQRVTEFTYEYKGLILLAKNPQSPHAFYEYDDQLRRVATGLYSSTASINVSTDIPTTETTNRIGLSEVAFDEMKRVYETKTHEIDPADGSSDNTIIAERWYDETGNVIKLKGSVFAKFEIDRLNRQIRQFILAKVDDTTYAHALDVAGDTVLEEYQTVYESGNSDDVLMTASIMRFHDDTSTTGALDSNSDGGTPDVLKLTAADINGRVMITSSWFNEINQKTEEVLYGQYDTDDDGDLDDFDRDGLSVPTRISSIITSGKALLTEYTYSADGSLLSVDDPENLETRYFYNNAGRKTKVIRNYTNGVAGGGTNDDEDQIVLYEYTDGLMTKMKADMPSGTDDQETIYTYGISTSDSPLASKITVNNVLRQVKYPDYDSGATRDYVLYGYNALGERLGMEDQNNNLIDNIYDTGGRLTKRTTTTLGSGVDGAVRRTEYAYTNLSQQSTITQYDATTAGNVVDEVKFSYHNMGFVSKFEQDHDSTVGGTKLYDVDYTYAKAAPTGGGRNTYRKTGMTLPSGAALTYVYGTSAYDDNVSRVTQVKHATTVVTSYEYLGVSRVVGIDYPEPDAHSKRYGSTSGIYDDYDRLDRPVQWDWTADLGTDVNFYDYDINWDKNSNVDYTADNVHANRDVDYFIDDLDRLIEAEEGVLSGSTIGTLARQEVFNLSQTGNWDLFRRDLNGDDDFKDTNEIDVEGTFNKVNELTDQDIDTDGDGFYDDTHYDLVFDTNGNNTDDNKAFKHEFDAFNRLRKVKNQSNVLVAEYWYNGLNYLIAKHEDTDNDGDVDGSDDVIHYVYDVQWRIVTTYENTDTGSSSKTEITRHNAGQSGFGDGSYIDEIILWESDELLEAGMETRRYICQNWRYDVVAVIRDDRRMVEWDAYSPYGVVFGFPFGDADSDGNRNFLDAAQIQTWIDASAYDVRGDVDLDGDVDATDKSLVQGTSSTMGRGVLTDVMNIFGYAGYFFDSTIGNKWHVRNRVLDSDNGRWLQRDPAEYIGGLNLYGFVVSNPLVYVDQLGFNGKRPTPFPAGGDPDDYPYKAPNPSAPGIPAPDSDVVGRRCWIKYDSCMYDAGTNSIKQWNCGEQLRACLKKGSTENDLLRLQIWCEGERLDTQWLNALPDCPCTVNIPQKIYPSYLPDQYVDETTPDPPPGWKWDSPFSPFFHPGSWKCIRSKPTRAGSSQQCCYDDSGKLITHGEGAGTPDRGAPGRLTPGKDHKEWDIDPYTVAKAICRFDLYWCGRPPNKGINCEKNP